MALNQSTLNLDTVRLNLRAVDGLIVDNSTVVNTSSYCRYEWDMVSSLIHGDMIYDFAGMVPTPTTTKNNNNKDPPTNSSTNTSNSNDSNDSTTDRMCFCLAIRP